MTHPLLGCWDAVSLTLSVDGELRHPLGVELHGQLIYAPDGRMSMQIVSAGRPGFASGDMRIAEEAELRAAFETSLAYFGAYELELERGLVHHQIVGSSFPNWTGKRETRAFRRDGDRLELRAPPERYAGREVIAIAIWRAISSPRG